MNSDSEQDKVFFPNNDNLSPKERLKAKMDAMMQEAKIAEAASPLPTATVVAALPMPTYPTDVSGCPNHLARSALFSPIKKGARKSWENEKIASRNDVFIYFTGRQLDMADCDVFLAAIKIAQGHPAGVDITFVRADYLRAIGRPTSKQQYQWLDQSIQRLTTSNIQIESRQYKASINLISGYELNKVSGQYWLSLNPKILKLFSRNNYAYIDMKKRINLKKDFAKWLQSYVASHKKGLHKVAVKKLYEWSGSSTLLKKWKAEKLKPALVELEGLKIITKVKVSEVAEWMKL